MENKNNYELIISVVNRGHSDLVVDAARNAGANGGTIIHGRGTSKGDNDSVLGVSIQPEKEIVLTLTKSETKKQIMEAICDNTNIDEAGKGICFSMPVSQVRGLSSAKKENK